MKEHQQSKTEIKLLILTFVIIGIIGMGMKYFEFLHIKEMSTTTNDIFEHPLKVSNASLTIKVDVYKIHRDMKDIVLPSTVKGIESFIQDIDNHENRVYKNLSIIEQNILGEDGLKLEADTKKLFKDWKPIRDEVISLVKNNKTNQAIAITQGKGAQHVLKLEDSALKLYTYAKNKATHFKNQSNNVFEELKIYNFFISLIYFLLFVLIGYYIISRISKFINKNEH
ncbi:MCP four helix bundle domain-containing protein [Sulfurimonas sp.]